MKRKSLELICGAHTYSTLLANTTTAVPVENGAKDRVESTGESAEFLLPDCKFLKHLLVQ